MAIEVEENDQGFGFTLTKAKNLGPGDFRTAFRRISRYWVGLIESGFRSERDPYGNPWARLNQQYATEKAKAGYKGGILTRTGAFRRSFQAVVNRTGFTIFTDHVFEDGTDASIHQFGGIHPVTRATIPERPVMPYDGFPPEWQQVAEGYLGDDIDNIFRDAA